MAEALISVIVPAYNHGRFLPATIDGIVAQDYPRTEIILVDDGSTDDTGAVGRELAAGIANLAYVHQENQGVGPARNLGISHSQGELIAICDADDMWLPNKLSQQVELFEDPEVGLAYTNCQVLGPRGYFPCDQAKPYQAGYQFSELLVHNFIPCSSAVFRRSCLAKCGLFHTDRRMMGVADKHMWLRLAKHYKLAGCPEVLLTLRQVADSMSADEDSMLEAELLCLDDIRRLFPPQGGEEENTFKRAYAATYAHYAQNFFSLGDLAKARAAWRQLKNFQPLAPDQRLKMALTYAPRPLAAFFRSLKRKVT